MRKAIATAIQSHRVVELRYKNHAERLVELHHYAVNRQGQSYVVGWQIEGYSTSGDLPGWRDFDVENINHLRVLKTRFRRRPADKTLEAFVVRHHLELCETPEQLHGLRR